MDNLTLRVFYKKEKNKQKNSIKTQNLTLKNKLTIKRKTVFNKQKESYNTLTRLLIRGMLANRAVFSRVHHWLKL